MEAERQHGHSVQAKGKCAVDTVHKQSCRTPAPSTTRSVENHAPMPSMLRLTVQVQSILLGPPSLSPTPLANIEQKQKRLTHYSE